jgi:ribosomal protein L11 methyltransferase
MSAQLWSLTVELPQSVADAAMDFLPADAVGQTAFRRESEDFSADPIWTVQGLYKEEPDAKEFHLELSILAAMHKHAPYRTALERISATGWIKKNEDSYVPIRAGRVVIHSRKDKAAAPHECGLALPIGAAFGTGEHPTTYGCLMALQQRGLLKRGTRVLDIGTGSGILALAVAKLGKVKIIAVDSDAESVTVARENVARNGVRSFVRVNKAEGFRHRFVARHKPYDIIVSNIFARPLMKLAPAMRRHLKPGGHIILAGFLRYDVNRVRNAYAAQKLRLEHCLFFRNWAILHLRRPGGQKP